MHIFTELQAELAALAYFMPTPQYQAVLDGLRSEESSFFVDKVRELGDIVLSKMPCPYGTEKVDESEKVAYLRYFIGSASFYIIERDALYCEDTQDYIRNNIQQEQAYSYGSTDGAYFEYGYAPICEMIKLGFELDLYFNPKTMSEILLNP